MSESVGRVVIVGGGAAGWLTAGILAAEHPPSSEGGLEVYLVESPDVPTIGVGEGTWPSMRGTLQKIGLSEADFIRECDGAFKQGSKFVAWATGKSNDQYYHPFTIPEGASETNVVLGWQTLAPQAPFDQVVCTQGGLCEKGRAPKQKETPEYAAVVNYGYHLDSVKFGRFLRNHCVKHLGVKHIVDHVSGVNSNETGDIASLNLQNSAELEGDLFVDCTGKKSLLLGEHFQVPFLEKRDILFNDAAIAMHVPYEQEDTPIASPTISTARKNGWIWDIGLPTRRGVGHVYSTSHVSDDEVEEDLRKFVAKRIGKKKTQELSCRKILINPGHREKFWHKNCVAIGMAAGFLEPLEASALALIELSATMLSEQFPATKSAIPIVAARFNETFRYRWDRVIDFLKLHYVLSQRSDSEYWRDNCHKDNIPVHLQELLTLWQHQIPTRYDFSRVEEVFPAASYQYVLYGMGFKTEQKPLRKHSRELKIAQTIFSKQEQLITKFTRGLPNNRELIEHICQYGLRK